MREEAIVALTQPTEKKLAQARARLGLPEKTQDIVGRIARFTTRSGDEITESTIRGTTLSEEYGIRLFPNHMILETGTVRHISFDQQAQCWCVYVDGRSFSRVLGDFVLL